VRRPVLASVWVTAALGVAAWHWPGHRRQLAGVWLGVVGALVVARLVSDLRREHPAPPTAAWHERRWARPLLALPAALRARLRSAPSRRSVTPELARVEGVVIDSLSSANGVHRRLRPMLREIAEDRLAMSHGLHIDGDDERVCDLLGEAVWELVRPGRPPPADAFAPGIDLRQLDAVITALKALG
jgi:hypothetical protein